MATDKSLYGRLSRLFNTNVIIRKVGKNQLKVVDNSHLQSVGNPRNSKFIDRFTRLHGVRPNASNTFNPNYNYFSSKTELYTDYEVMDSDPIISSALDIYSDECLSGDTRIPLLDGRICTIKELYENGEKNIWLYGLDVSDGTMKPVQASHVACNGLKPVYELTLEDGTIIKCTSNHIWVNSNKELVTTDKLNIGDGIYALSTKISNNRQINGYEMIWNKTKFDYTHRIVARKTDYLIEQRKKLSNRAIIHHAAFNKRNNSPEQLQWLEPADHMRIHAEFNKKIWNDLDNVHEYKHKIREAHKRYWTPELRKHVSNRQRNFMNSYISSLSSEERKYIYGHMGSKNGMYNNGYKVSGECNGRYLHDKIRVIDIENFLQYLFEEKKYTSIATPSSKNLKTLLAEYFNINEDELLGTFIEEVSSKIRVYLGCSHVKLAPVYYFLKKNPGILSDVKREYINSSHISEWHRLNHVCKILQVEKSLIYHTILSIGYKNLKQFIQSSNHKIISIKYIGEETVYDIVNAGDNHLFAIEANDGSKLYTHNCILRDDFGDILSIKSDDENIKKILENLFYDVLNIEFNLWSWTRNMCKYGDCYLLLDIQDGLGIVNVTPKSAYEIIREEGMSENNPYHVQFKQVGSNSIIYENYEIAHFRLLSDSNFLPYGKSMIEPARKVWKQLTLMEDAMLIHRIMRAPEKRIFKIDVGNIPPNEVDNYIQKIINQMKKTPYRDPQTGDYNLKFNMMNMLEDYFLPVRGGQSGTEIDTLSGMEYTGIDDIEYLRNKMMAALKVPKAFLGYDESITGKATLAAEDVRFARTIERIQRIIISELYKIAIIHLYSQGYENADLINFELTMTSPSTIYEQEKLTLYTSKVDLAGSMIEKKLFSKEWIYKNIFNFTDDDTQQIQNGIIEDQKEEYRMSQISEQGEDPATEKKEPESEETEGSEDKGEPGAEGGEKEGEEGSAENPFKEESIDLNLQKQYDKRANGTRQPNVPKGGWPGAGRPKEHVKYNTHEHPRGYDPIGRVAWRNSRNENTNQLKKYNLEPLSKLLTEKQLKSLLDETNLLNEDI